MSTHRRRVRPGPSPSSTLLTPDRAGNVVGIDPHKRTLTAAIVDPRGGIVASEHFRVSGDGHRALETWAAQSGAIARVGIEGASDTLDAERIARETLAHPLLLTRRRRFQPAAAQRITLLGQYRAEVAELDAEEKIIRRQLARLVESSGNTLD
jgi:hypothetical protein